MNRFRKFWWRRKFNYLSLQIMLMANWVEFKRIYREIQKAQRVPHIYFYGGVFPEPMKSGYGYVLNNDTLVLPIRWESMIAFDTHRGGRSLAGLNVLFSPHLA